MLRGDDMPCWTIHTAIAKDLNKELKLNPDLLYYGSILPDVDKGNEVGKFKAHFYIKHPKYPDEVIVDFDKFIEKYNNRLDRDLIIGYYIHLLTDYFFNEFIFDNTYIIDNGSIREIKLLLGTTNDIESRRRLKQNDFIMFGSYLLNNNRVGIPKDKEIIYKHLSDLNHSFINEIEVSNRIDYMNSNDFIEYNNKEENYKLFTREIYEKLYDDCLEFIRNKLAKNS